jgi:uncharacterized protein (UPF0548 family)
VPTKVGFGNACWFQSLRTVRWRMNQQLRIRAKEPKMTVHREFRRLDCFPSLSLLVKSLLLGKLGEEEGCRRLLNRFEDSRP